MANKSGSGFLLRMTSEITNEAKLAIEASTTRWTPVGWVKQLLTGGMSFVLSPFLTAASVLCFLAESAPVEIRLQHVQHFAKPP